MQEARIHTALDQHVIRTLLYYDIFNYPLTGCEVFRFLGMRSATEEEVLESLDGLCEEGLLARTGEYYSLQFDEALVRRRIEGNRKAREFYTLALKKARLISKFPFVRAVMGSGSLSKDYMDESCDLDFFIVTAPGRLWIARSFLVIYKRIFLGNSHRLFCVNYFIDEDHLEIEEQNLFTATELATVLPLYGAALYRRLHRQNRHWLTRFLPHCHARETSGIEDSAASVLKRMLEKLIDIFPARVIENLLMKLTLKRWEVLYGGDYDKHDFSIAFKTKKHVSKNHPRNFQKKIMQVYRQKLEWFNGKGFDEIHD